MITFKEFILELIAEEWEHSSFNSGTKSVHSKTVGGMKVNITAYKHHKPDGTKEHTIDFTVNGDTSKSSEHGLHSGAGALAHVGHAIHGYIKKHVSKGDEVHMNAGDDNPDMLAKKDKMYGSYTKKLASSTGGTYDSEKFGKKITIHKIKY